MADEEQAVVGHVPMVTGAVFLNECSGDNILFVLPSLLIVLRPYGVIPYVKGTIRRISPGRNRVNFQILAYLLTIGLLYSTGCLSY